MRLVGDVVSQLHLERRVEQPAIRDGRRVVPNLDNVEVTFGRESHSDDRVVILLQHLVRKAVNHAVHEDLVRLRGIHFLGPGATLVILGRVPQRTESITHQEEHSGVPGLRRDCFHDRPELSGGREGQDLNVAVERVICVVGVVIPQHPCLRKVGHSVKRARTTVLFSSDPF